MRPGTCSWASSVPTYRCCWRPFDDEIRTGDVILQSDPYLCGGAIQHTPDWLVLAPVDYEGERVGYASMFGHVLDCGGTVPGSMAATATSIWDEGIRIPPVKPLPPGIG